MFRFLVRLWKWIKSWFKRNESPAVTAPKSTSHKPELSDLEYENLLLELLEEVVQGSNWGEIQGFLYGNNLEPEKLASWLSQFGQRWLVQPESHQELGHRLLLLSKLARGELREVTRELGQSIYIVKNEEEELENTETINNTSSLTLSQSDVQLPQIFVQTLEEQNSVKSQNAEYFFNQGILAIELGKTEKALACFNQVISLQPNYHQAWYNRGILLSQLGRDEEALASSDQTLKLKPDYYQAWSNRGVALNELGRNEEAIVSYDQALKLKPDYYQAWLNRGKALRELERKEEALASYEQALKLKPNYEEVWSNRGHALNELGRNEETVASYEQALKLKPNYEEVWSNCGAILNNLGRTEEALFFGGQAIKLKHNDYHAWHVRGYALNRLVRYEEAVACFDQVLKLKPDFYYAWLERSMAVYNSKSRNPYIQQEFVGLFCSEVSQDAQKAILSFEELDPSQIITNLKTSLENSKLLLIKTFDDDNSIKLIEQINQDPSKELYKLIQQAIPRKLIDLIQQPVSAKVVAQLEQDLFSHPHLFNPQLNLRGYQGKIASLEAELDRAIKKDTHPLGWGKLHHEIGNTHYFEGRKNSHPFDYWHKAVASYDRALETLTEADYPEVHLEVLQDLIKVQLGFGKTEEADQLRLKGLEVLKNLLNQTSSFAAKKNLELKFVAFRQLNVDILINQGQLIEALTSAELSKNICLNNLLYAWQEQTVCPSYEQIQELLTPERAIIYWHLSPQSLNIFIIKANASEPIIIQQSLEKKQETTELPRSLKRLQEYKTWLKQWNEQYSGSQISEIH